MKKINKTPGVGVYLNDEERDLIQLVESDTFAFKSVLTPERKKQIEEMARATMNDEQSQKRNNS